MSRLAFSFVSIMSNWFPNVSVEIYRSSGMLPVGYSRNFAGTTIRGIPQTMGNFNRPTKEMERLFLSGDVVIDNNEITRWCFRNVELKSDYNGNVKPNKSLETKKIDWAIAMIQALGTYLTVPHYSNEITVI